MSTQPLPTEKKTLSTEEIEAQTALELPDREVLAAIGIGNVSVNAAFAANFCGAAAVGAAAVQAPACAIVVIQG